MTANVDSMVSVLWASTFYLVPVLSVLIKDVLPEPGWLPNSDFQNPRTLRTENEEEHSVAHVSFEMRSIPDHLSASPDNKRYPRPRI